MKNTIHDLLNKKKKKILEEWIHRLLEDTFIQENNISNEEINQQSKELLDHLIEGVKFNNYDDFSAPEYEKLSETLASLSTSWAHQGFSASETANYVFSLRETLVKNLEQDYKKNPEQLYEQSRIINKLIDSLGIITFETFLKAREEVIIRQTREISEITTPVIRVWEGILVMPIIGTLDSSRTQVVMESLLQEIVKTGSNIAILDISGVPAVDSMVAQHLIKTVTATKLLGAECIISGIKPETAQTVVHLGIDLSSIITKSHLASALGYAFKLEKLEVRKTS